MLSEFGKAYIVSAVSRGLSRRLIMKHALKNALLPISTLLALSFTTLIGGSVIIESVFSWPGIGSYAMSSVLHHDYPVIQGYTVIMVGLVILINLLVDLMYSFADPKLRADVLQRKVKIEKNAK
jgi:peptide/nickel transport system permease protein